jgi:hypothetical protein
MLVHSQIRHLRKVQCCWRRFHRMLFCLHGRRILEKSLKTVNVHLYTTDSREMRVKTPHKSCPDSGSQENATHARSPFFPF